jgi:hypothetical protein
MRNENIGTGTNAGTIEIQFVDAEQRPLTPRWPTGRSSTSP